MDPTKRTPEEEAKMPGVFIPQQQAPKPKTQNLKGEGEEEEEEEDVNMDKPGGPENQRDNPEPGSTNVWEFIFDALTKPVAMALALSMDIIGSAVKGSFHVALGAIKATAGIVTSPFDGGKLLASGAKDIGKGIGEMIAPVAGLAANAVKFLPVPGAEKLGNFLAKGVDKLDPDALKVTTNQMNVEFPNAVKAFKGSPKPTPENTKKNELEKKPVAPKPKTVNNDVDSSLKRRLADAQANNASLQRNGEAPAKQKSNTYMYDNHKKHNKVDVKPQAKPKSVAENADKPKSSSDNRPRPSPSKSR